MRFFRHLFGILPLSLGLGLVLSFLDGGILWIGLLAYASLLTLGLLALTALWRSAGASRLLILMLLLALFLRLGLGVAFSFILPTYGNDNEMQNAGYIFRDSYQRDNQAWALADSETPLWQAFDKSYSSDQYGGLLFVSGVIYRFLSPDMHRPWLIILLAALTAAIGIGLAFRAAQVAWEKKLSFLIVWILTLYPESILLGSAQMREPFLMTFIAMTFWGIMIWKRNRWKGVAWVAGGVSGMLLFSPGVAAASIVILAVWFWLNSRELHPRGWVIAAVLVLIVFSLLLLARAVSGSLQVQGGLLENLVNWLRLSSQWDAYLLELRSGWIQNVFDALPSYLHFPFIIGYGITQPLLPAAIADPAVWPVRILNILRGLGWYALLPFLVFGFRSIIKTGDKRERFAWLWLMLVTWVWIFLSAARAGGDAWDNPRYRVIFLLFQAAVAAQALTWQRVTKDHWLGRFLAVEGVFLVFFGYWYAARYTGWQAGQVHVFAIIALIVIVSSIILVGCWMSDRRRGRRA
jgi:hypothetical protein